MQWGGRPCCPRGKALGGGEVGLLVAGVNHARKSDVHLKALSTVSAVFTSVSVEQGAQSGVNVVGDLCPASLWRSLDCPT
jgi:hypothetical protein